MNKTRLEAFSDAVLAIIITIMVLELKVPHETNLAVLINLAPIFISYVLSFIYIAIYWNNHHHLMHLVQKVNGPVLWSNMHLLFWLTLIPFTTAWMGENNFEAGPVALYGTVLLFSAIAYFILVHVLVALHGRSCLAEALGNELKEKISILIYVLGVALAFAYPGISLILYALVALMWLVPDRRIEKIVAK